jgi:hypothetical protein
VQDVVVGPVLSDVVAMISTRPRYVVVLDPDPAAVVEREAGRRRTGYGEGRRPEVFVADLRRTTLRTGPWLDTSGRDPSTTVSTIVERLAEARVDDPVLPPAPSP